MNRLLAMFGGPFPIVCDGAWGTEFQKRGLPPGVPADAWNLDRPGDVEAVARSYVEAGSRVLLTNTFRANPVALAGIGLADRMAEINRRGVELSRAATAGSDVKVFGSIGPLGRKLDATAAVAASRAQAEALAEAGAEALVCETLGDPEEARLAIAAARATGLPVVASFSFGGPSGADHTYAGATPEQAALAAAGAGADAVGLNCGVGPDERFLEIAHRLSRAARLPLWIQSSAGPPGALWTPDAFAATLPSLIEAGASFVGGCCGAGPDHIRCLAAGANGRNRDTFRSHPRP